MPYQSFTSKGAEVASGLGAVVLGAGLALMAPAKFQAYAVSILVTGAAVHALGMTLKYRLDHRSGPPPWWARGMFWLCWLCLGALAAWLVVHQFTT